ncbi:hypothetical protein [Bradyrhizobium elkanii]|uniref:hypothetical protein n=1 Tax=Bradyrhizobium elkanii TaxID=29448 RepID=UPI00384E8FB2
MPEATPVPTAATVNLSGALAECRSAFPDQIAQAVARASCVIKATDLVRPLLPFPELLDRENALRKALAEQVQTRTMSLLERNIQIQKLHSQLLEEERSRLSAAPAGREQAAAGGHAVAAIQRGELRPARRGLRDVLLRGARSAKGAVRSRSPSSSY